MGPEPYVAMDTFSSTGWSVWQGQRCVTSGLVQVDAVLLAERLNIEQERNQFDLAAAAAEVVRMMETPGSMTIETEECSQAFRSLRLALGMEDNG